MTLKKKKTLKTIETLTHDEASRKNIPTAEYQSVMRKDKQTPIRIAYERRNRDLDPQLVWRGKDEQDWSDLVVHAPPLYIQEKVHPKVLIDDLLKQTQAQKMSGAPQQMDLFSESRQTGCWLLNCRTLTEIRKKVAAQSQYLMGRNQLL